MLEWLNDEEAARQKPARVLITATLTVFCGVGAIVYFGADHRNLVAGLAAGVGAALLMDIALIRTLWPTKLTALAASDQTKSMNVLAGWYFPVFCLVIAIALLVDGLVARNGGVAIAALPFIALAGVPVALRRLRRDPPSN